MAKQKQDDQLENTYSSYVMIRNVALKTCQRQWMMGRSSERGSGISVKAARHDDDDDDDDDDTYLKRISANNCFIEKVKNWNIMQEEVTVNKIIDTNLTSRCFKTNRVWKWIQRVDFKS